MISIESSSGDMTHAEEDTLEALLTQIDTLLISFVGVGHLEDVPSCKQQCLLFQYILKYFYQGFYHFFIVTAYKTDTTDTDQFKQSPQRQSQGSSKITAIIAVTVSIVVAAVSAAVIALLITHVWKRHQRSKTTIV